MKNTPKDLIWYGPVYSYSGYAMHNRCMVFELHKIGWNIQLIPTDDHIPAALIGKELLIKLSQNRVPNPEKTICINLIPPPAIPYTAGYNILFTTIESKTVHEGFLNRVSQYDEVWFPCKSNVKSFTDTGYPKNKIYYCPEGVYSTFFNPSMAKGRKYKNSLFTFFYNGDWSYRKGVDLMIKSFSAAFSPTDPVRLLLLVHYQGAGLEASRLAIGEDIQYWMKKYDIKKLPRIDFIFDHVNDPDLPDLYCSSDVYLAPTRGEAWGLPIIQAMSCGIPPIVTNWGGQLDYCNKDNSFLINLEKFDTFDDKVNLDVDFYKYQLFPFPSSKHLTELMIYCFNHPDIVKQTGIKAQEYVAKNFTWCQAGQIADKRLKYIYERFIR